MKHCGTHAPQRFPHALRFSRSSASPRIGIHAQNGSRFAFETAAPIVPQDRRQKRRRMRVCIITGGGSGIGAAVARRLAGNGQCLMLHGQGADEAGLSRLKSVASECERAGARVAWATGDLSCAGAAADLVRAARASFGVIDVIVHAAGFADRRGFTSLPREGLERAYAVMAAAFHELATSALADLTRDKSGRAVAISSFGAHRFVPDGIYPASAAAKAALEVLVKSLAIELAPSGATANIVVPGYTRKDPGLFGALDAGAWDKVAKANPQARLAEPDEVAAVVGFLLSKDAGHVTGATVPVDGGLTLM